MHYTIEKLSPKHTQTFIDYIGNLSFHHAPEWSGCYCRFYHTTCDQETWKNRSSETNRIEAIEEISANRMQGYLVFDDAKCIGWLNANDANRFVRLREDFKPYCEGKKVAATMCFIIHPEYRSQGIARMVLDRVIDDYRALGYDALIALPFDDPKAPQKRYRGTYNMYLEKGYTCLDTFETVKVLWLEL